MKLCKTKLSQKRHFLIGLSIVFLPMLLSAQAPEPPLPVELMFGHQGVYFQLVIKKKFAPESKLGFFSVATFTASYDEPSEASITLPVNINYSLGKGFALQAGASVNSVAGFSPMVGPQHNYASRKFLAVTVASYLINEGHDVSIFGLYEYRPTINDKWSHYSRIQFVYNHSLSEKSHNRSYLYLRYGVKKKSMAFGLGANLDRYGPYKSFHDNYGVFVKWEFR